jgi:ketosteroid isomerase-like protein
VAANDVELVRGLYEAWLSGDRERAAQGVHPQIEWVEPPQSPDSETHQGPEGVEYSMDRWTEPFANWRMESDELRDLGEGKVLVVGRQFARARDSEVEVEAPIFHLWTVRDERAIRMQMFLSEGEALAAAASRPEDRA